MEATQIIQQVHATGACIQLEGDSITVAPLSVVTDDLVDQIRKNRNEIYQALKKTTTCLVELAIAKAWTLYEQRVTESEVLRLAEDTSSLADCSASALDGWACALALRTVQVRGMVPKGWNKVSNCRRCGPVWSDHGLDTLSCGWCEMRTVGKWFPRP